MWVVPAATLRHITNVSQGVRDKTLGLIVHVQAGNGELTGWYNNPGSEASSAWQVMKSGQVFQFGDPDADKFWTQAAGNPDYGAAEGEGQPSEPMTPAQIEGFARIYAKGHLEEGWPFQLAEKPGDRGLGWHGMGGKAWGNHPNCPGDIRKAQRPLILARARQIAGVAPTQEDDMSAADVKEIKDHINALLLKGYQEKTGGPVLPALRPISVETQRRVDNLTVQVAGLSAAVKALAESKPGVDPAELLATVKASVDAGVASALADVSVTLSAGD